MGQEDKHGCSLQTHFLGSVCKLERGRATTSFLAISANAMLLYYPIYIHVTCNKWSKMLLEKNENCTDTHAPIAYIHDWNLLKNCHLTETFTPHLNVENKADYCKPHSRDFHHSFHKKGTTHNKITHSWNEKAGNNLWGRGRFAAGTRERYRCGRLAWRSSSIWE